METVIQELIKHFTDAWSSPGDLWNPAKVIEKIESMEEEERQQLIDAYEAGEDNGSHPNPTESAQSYYDNTYGKGS